MKMLKVVVLFIFTITSIPCYQSARILAMFPIHSVTHQSVFRKIIQELLNREHEIVVISTLPLNITGKSAKNLTEINITHNATEYNVINEALNTGIGKKYLGLELCRHVQIMYNKISVIHFGCDAIQNLINDKEKSFDLIIVENHYRLTIMLSFVYKVPVILMSSYFALSSYEIVGAPTHPLLFPSVLPYSYKNFNMWEQLKELTTDILIARLVFTNADSENRVMANFFHNIPTIDELFNNVNMLVLNTNIIWEGIRPVPLSVVHLGGVHQKPQMELPKDLKKYLDSSKNGVIYMSFGTSVNSTCIPKEKVDIFIKVFSELPYNVLWKWENDEQHGTAKNIKTAKWFPQSDLLRHPKVKLFITQAGLQSTDEAITAGVPLIGIPMIFDQWCNAEKYVHHKIGLKLEIETLNEDQLRNAIETVITDESYRQNVVKLRTLIYDQPQSALERAMWWIEHVLRHGSAIHLRAPAANIYWTQYLELELVLIFLAAIIIVFSLITYLVSRLLKCVKQIFMYLFKTN